jgi:hypothetical protein
MGILSYVAGMYGDSMSCSEHPSLTKSVTQGVSQPLKAKLSGGRFSAPWTAVNGGFGLTAVG